MKRGQRREVAAGAAHVLELFVYKLHLVTGEVQRIGGGDDGHQLVLNVREINDLGLSLAFIERGLTANGTIASSYGSSF